MTPSSAASEGTDPDPGRPDWPELSYEQARAELARIVERLESGAGTLEEALALWERGERLAEICQRWLDGARARLNAARAPSSQDQSSDQSSSQDPSS